MEETDVEEMLTKCQAKAESFFNAVRDQHLALGLRFSGTPLPVGYHENRGGGGTLLPSPTEMRDLAELISLVLNSWTQSSKMPTVEALHSSAQSMEVDPVVYITTLYSMAMLGAFLPVICDGDLVTAFSTLDVMTQTEAPPGTSQPTSSRKIPRPLSGPSITNSPEKESPSPWAALKDEKPDGSATSRPAPKRKKKAPIKPGRKRRKKNVR